MCSFQLLSRKGGVGKTCIASNLTAVMNANGLEAGISVVDGIGPSTDWGGVIPVIITTPDPLAVVAAYETLRDIPSDKHPVSILVNCAPSHREGRNVFRRIESTASRFLQRRVRYVGAIRRDRMFVRAVAQEQPLIHAFPRSRSARDLTALADRLVRQASPTLTDTLALSDCDSINLANFEASTDYSGVQRRYT